MILYFLIRNYAYFYFYMLNAYKCKFLLPEFLISRVQRVYMANKCYIMTEIESTKFLDILKVITLTFVL